MHVGLDGGKLFVGAAGMRFGDTWYACLYGMGIVATPSKCRVVGQRGARCTIMDQHIEVRHGEHTQLVSIRGNLLLQESSVPAEPRHMSSFDAAQKYSDDRGDAGTAGARIVKFKGCITCHSDDGSTKLGPTFKGLYGSTKDGFTVDETYVRESIREPTAKVRPGFPAGVCVKFTPDVMDDYDIEHIVTYLKKLAE